MINYLTRIVLLIPLLAVVVASMAACGGNGDHPTPSRPIDTRPLPSSVAYRPDPEGVTLGDPTFQPIAGAQADYGRLGGSVYQIEVPKNWNGRLLLYMHGYDEMAPTAKVGPPDIRRYLIGHGWAWGASSFSSTMLIPGRAADETAALWDYFAQEYGRPNETYVTGESMGGTATNIAAERYPERFDGALALCGAAGVPPGLADDTDYYVAGAYVAGVTQMEFDSRKDNHQLVQRIRDALKDPTAEQRFENIMIDLTGGPRAFDHEGFRIEEDTNWRRSEQIATIGLAGNIGKNYKLGPLSDVSSEDFNRDVLRLTPNEATVQGFVTNSVITGDIKIPLLTMHTTGDWQVPIDEAQILQRTADTAGQSDLLVQRVIRDPNHCGFSPAEQEAGLEALVGWVENGVKPQGEDVLVDDLRTLGGKFELTPRPDTAEADAVEGAGDRAVIRGNLKLDGQPFDATWLGAVVRRDGLVTACQYTLTPVEAGRFEITVMADAEASGCGAGGGEILFWTFAGNKQLWSSDWVPWPGNGATADFDTSFTLSQPNGASAPAAQFVGGIYDSSGTQLPPGTRVEAYVGDRLCGVASLRRTGSFTGYVLSVVGPESVAGCGTGATVTFRVDGKQVPETALNDPAAAGHNLDLTLP